MGRCGQPEAATILAASSGLAMDRGSSTAVFGILPKPGGRRFCAGALDRFAF